MYEHRALIVGAGVAGISAALWLRDLKVPFDWFERAERIGGTLHCVYNPIMNLAGDNLADGAALIARLVGQLGALGLAPTFGAAVLRLRAPAEAGWVEVHSAVGGEERCARYGAVLVATGTARRRLGLDGEQAHVGRGVAVSGSHEKERFAGRKIVIIGGGDAALENALLLSRHAREVVLAHRSDQFRARPEFVEAVARRPNVEVRLFTHVLALEGDAGAPFLDAVWMRGATGEAYREATDGLLARIGVSGVLPDIRIDGHPPLTSEGNYLVVDHQGRTHHRRIFGIGDCTCPEFRAVAVAMGQGAMAARTAAFLMGHYG